MTLAQLIPLAISTSVFLTVFGLGLDSDVRDATYLFRRPSLFLRSILSMNVLMVVLVAAVASLFEFDSAIKIALVALAVSPVPPLLPKKQSKAGGSDSYAIGLLVAAVLLSIVLVPAWTEFLGRYFGVEAHVPPGKVIPIVLISAIVPLLAGIAFRRLLPDLAARIARPVSLLATALLVAAALPVLFTISGVIWSLVGNGVLLVLALFTLAGLAIGHLLGGPDPDERTDLALATSARHPGIAMLIAGLNFPDQKAAVLAVVICHLIVGAVIAIPYVRWRRLSRTTRIDHAKP